MPKVKSNYQGVDGAYYVVNPSGAVHSCTREHAKTRLSQVGWRLATDSEIAVYRETKLQRADRPIAERWSPEPDVEALVPEADDGKPAEATDGAKMLAEANGIDLATVTGTGAGGRILVKDLQGRIGTGETE